MFLTPSQSITSLRNFAHCLLPSMDELIVPNSEHPHSQTQASSDDPVNNSRTEFSSLLIYGGSGNLYQQKNKNA